MGKTTTKAISLGYRNVGSSGEYTRVMGVLKGLTVGQDEPDSSEIEAEFYDSPFDVFYEGNPVTLTFELANYELSELPALFGGSVSDGDYEAAANAFTSEHEWKLDFRRGHAAIVIYRGLTIGTAKKDAEGALNYSVTITALVYKDNEEHEHIYKIVGRPTPPFATISMSPTSIVPPSGTILEGEHLYLHLNEDVEYGREFHMSGTGGTFDATLEVGSDEDSMRIGWNTDISATIYNTTKITAGVYELTAHNGDTDIDGCNYLYYTAIETDTMFAHYIEEQDVYCLACKTNTDKKVAMSFGGMLAITEDVSSLTAPVEDITALFAFTPSTVPVGTTEEMPENFTPITMSDLAPDSISDIAVVSAKIGAEDWDWDGESANYAVTFMVGDVDVKSNWLIANDQSPLGLSIDKMPRRVAYKFSTSSENTTDWDTTSSYDHGLRLYCHVVNPMDAYTQIGVPHTNPSFILADETTSVNAGYGEDWYAWYETNEAGQVWEFRSDVDANVLADGTFIKTVYTDGTYDVWE